MSAVNDHPRRAGAFGCALLFLACGGATSSAPELTPRAGLAEPSVVPERRADVPDDCTPLPGQPPPEALRVPYAGLAKRARCQREVFTIMGGVTHFLGVQCKHCHLEPDYAADTHNKRVANWMATELVPRLAQRSGGEVWCQDCHAGQAKLLGNPRRADLAVDWMLTHLVDGFQTKRGLPPKCKDCHGGDLGSPEFRPKIVLTALGGAPASLVAPAAPSTAAPASRDAPAPVPDFGGR